MVQIIKKQGRCSGALRHVLRITIRCYQWFIAPVLPKTCRFYPSCSEYTLTAIEQNGAIKGMGQSLYRLSRCHPWSKGGYDPVLPNKEKC
jgi:hypothetical protein